MASFSVLVYLQLTSPVIGLWSFAVRAWAWHLDLVSASYYASEFHYSDINPESNTILQLVVKTRGGQQYYQSAATMSWDLSWRDVVNRARVMDNTSRRLSVLEAAGRNRALSVQRKAYALALFLIVGIVLERVFDVDISLLT